MKICCLTSGTVGGGVKMMVRLASNLCENHNVTILYPLVKHFTTYHVLRETNDKVKLQYIKNELLASGFNDTLAQFYSSKLLSKYKRNKVAKISSIIKNKNKKKFFFNADLDNRVHLKNYPMVISESMLKGFDLIIYQSVWQYHELKNVTPKNIKRIHWSLADYLFCNGINFPLSNILEAYNSNDVIIAPSTITALKLENYGFNVNSIIHGGIDRLFSPNSELNKGEVKNILGYFQPAWWVKGAASILQCFKRIRINYPTITLTLFGHQQSDIGLYNEVCDNFFTDLSSIEVRDLYRKNDIFVYPSYCDGFPSTPLEAMASGCAVVSTKVGAVPEYATHGKNALLSDPMDDDSLYKNIVDLIEGKVTRNKLIEDGINSAKNWTWAETANQFNQLFDDLSPQK
ncbi:MAG: hypothetical protein CMG75_07635 [Candidatus Marinimicrobia bacterium]|nr:hypothetical protein [Candidatus Neomarinimicrobiota bacterium]|tara:strand:+ start:16593 stop:17798 length:1206 start_codon:yes stop_codon:yes gene_type:complete